MKGTPNSSIVMPTDFIQKVADSLKILIQRYAEFLNEPDLKKIKANLSIQIRNERKITFLDTEIKRVEHEMQNEKGWENFVPENFDETIFVFTKEAIKLHPEQGVFEKLNNLLSGNVNAITVYPAEINLERRISINDSVESIIVKVSTDEGEIEKRLNFGSKRILQIANIKSKLEELKFMQKVYGDLSLLNTNEIDDRIRCKIGVEEIRQYFQKLAHIHDGKQIMSEEDVDYFLGQNFYGFERKGAPKIFTVNTTAITVKYFVHQFYHKYGKSSHDAKKFVRLLKDNFSLFDEYTDETLGKKFSQEPQMFPDYLR